MKYLAPSKVAGERLGVVLHDDWGLTGQEKLQESIKSTPFPERYDSDAVNILWVSLAVKFPELKTLNICNTSRFHIVFGCISQFNFDDIKCFIEVDYPNRPLSLEARSDRLRESEGNGAYQWVMSGPTLDKIESAIMKKAA